MDGFDQTTTIKVIMATNRADTLDPALLRPGRLDRKIEFPLPDRRQKRLVFQVSLGHYIIAKSARKLFISLPEIFSSNPDLARIKFFARLAVLTRIT